MPRKTQTYKVVGSTALDVGPKTYQPDDEFDATPGEVAFFKQIGAVAPVEKKQDGGRS